MVARLKEINAVRLDTVDDAVLRRQAARPGIRVEVPQRFRLADADERVPQDYLNEG